MLYFFILSLWSAVSTAHAIVPPQCLDLFQIDSPDAVAKTIAPFTETRSSSATHDSPQHGHLILQGDRRALGRVLRLIEDRDGTYPLLIAQDLTIAMDHRLSNPNPEGAMGFVGNHRGLYQMMVQTLGTPPAIIFAGQIRVVGGRVVNLIDQAGTFYDIPDPVIEAFNPSIARDDLVRKNQARLDFAANFLKLLNIIDDKTEIYNFQVRFGGKEDRFEGHVKAYVVANFERICRLDRNCWATVESLTPYLQKIMKKGGSQYLVTRFKEFFQIKHPQIFGVVSLWGMIAAEGLMDVMSYEGMLDPSTEKGATFRALLDITPEMFKDLD